MIGPSYLGLVQWAVAPEAGDDLAALAIQVERLAVPRPDLCRRQPVAGDGRLVAGARRRAGAPARAAGDGHAACAGCPRCSPSCRSPRSTSGRPGRRWPGTARALASPRREDAYWVTRDYAAGVAKVTAPVQLIGGWYDIFLPWMLEDFTRAAGRRPRRAAVIGPWTHTAPGLLAAGLREGLAWLRAQLLDDHRLVRPARVRVFVTGERAGGGWRELPSWPPPGTAERRLWLGRGRRAAGARARRARRAPDRYRYDPADPTPSLGGPVLLAREPVVDNRPLEARPDVLTYTTAPLPRPRGDRTGAGRAVGARELAALRRVRPGVRRRSERGLVERLRRLIRVAPGRFERSTPTAPGGSAFELWPIGPPLRRRASHPPAGLLRRPPALRPQPGHRREPTTATAIATAHRSTSRSCTAPRIRRRSCCPQLPPASNRRARSRGLSDQAVAAVPPDCLVEDSLHQHGAEVIAIETACGDSLVENHRNVGSACRVGCNVSQRR